MKYIKYFFAAIVFMVAMPISWAAAWIAGSWFTFLISLALPTYGLVYLLLEPVLGSGFIHSIASFTLGFAGAALSLMLLTYFTQERATHDTNVGNSGPRMPDLQSKEDIDISNFHPALDAAVEWTIDSLIAGALTNRGRSEPQLAITAEMMVFTATCRAKLEGSTDIHRTVWNTFKSGVENRIIEHVEDNPPRSDVIETAHSTTYVSLTSEYYAMLDDIEEALEASRQTELGKSPVRLLNSFREQLGSVIGVNSPDVEAVIVSLQEFSRQQILPRVARIF